LPAPGGDPTNSSLDDRPGPSVAILVPEPTEPPFSSGPGSTGRLVARYACAAGWAPVEQQCDAGREGDEAERSEGGG
jgi:hypothetical protein